MIESLQFKMQISPLSLALARSCSFLSRSLARALARLSHVSTNSKSFESSLHRATMAQNTRPTAIPEPVSSKEQTGIDMTVSTGKEDSVETTDQLSVMEKQEKQQNLEYTTDGSVDLRGKQAVISRTGGHRSLPFTLGCLFLVRTAYDAVTTNLVVYLTEKLHINNSKAASDVNSWLASSSVFSLFGAIVADSYSGRCLTSLVSILVHMIGMAILVIATALPSLKPHKCTGSCAETTGIRKAVFYLGLYITALGCGSFFPCFIAFGADQYDEGHPIEINKKSRYFSVSYLAVSCGGILGNTIIIYIEQNVSFTLGYGMSIGVLAIALLLNLAGTRFYRFQKPKGNPLTRIVQVWVAAAQKWGIKVSAPDKQLYEAPVDNKTGTPKLLHTEQFRFLDKAAIVTNSAEEVDESKRNPWKLCTVTQVEEAKFLLQIAPIWLSIVIYSMVDAQMWSVFVEQAATMDNLLNNFTVPPASMSIFNILSVCICIFAYEIIIVPIARRFTRHPRGLTTLQRTGVGLILGMFSMLSAALVEINRLRIAKAYALHHNPTATVPLSVFWLAPQYFLGGASEAFVESGQFEFFYSQAPESIRGIATSLHFAAYAMGCYMSGILITVVTSITSHGDNSGWISDNLNVNSRLDYFFGVMILIGALNFAGYLIFTYRYKYKNPVNEVGKIS